MIASSYTLAAAVCSLCVAIIGMPMGRRNCLLMGNVLVIVGAIFQASSWSVAQIIAARVLCGLGIGFISSTTPTFLVGLPLLLQMAIH
jgi:predicted MFS family arabinose efflux permease